MDLSIIIVNWNTKNLLAKCLESIIKFTDKIRYEIIVVDNGSDDGSVEMLTSKFTSVILIKNDQNEGFSRAVNKGLKAATGENMLLLNSDTFISDNTFGKMVNLMQKQAHIGAMTCKVLYPDGRTQPALAKYPSLMGALYDFIKIVGLFSDHKLFDKWNVTKWDYHTSREIEEDMMIGGGCFMIRKKVVEKIGYMDENFTPAYCEDADWSYRIKENGLKMFYFSEAGIYHYHGYTCKNSDEKFKEYLTLATQKNRQYFFKKHYGTGKLLLLKLIDILQNMLFVLYIAFKICLKFRSNNRDLNKKLKLYIKLTLNSFMSF